MYVGAIENPAGETVHDHNDPFKGWVPPLEGAVT
jgi:hypothetical protein